MHPVAGGRLMSGVFLCRSESPLRPGVQGKTHFSRKKTGKPAQVGARTGSPSFGRVRGAPRPHRVTPRPCGHGPRPK